MIRRSSPSSPWKDLVLAWGPAVTWAAVLLLLNEVRVLPGELRPVMDLLGDKIVHVLLYLTLGVALAWGRVRVEGRVPHLALLAAGYAYGGLTEWHQSLVPGRTPSLGDWGANVAGVSLGYLAMLAAMRLSRREARAASAPPGAASRSAGGGLGQGPSGD